MNGGLLSPSTICLISFVSKIQNLSIIMKFIFAYLDLELLRKPFVIESLNQISLIDLILIIFLKSISY